MSIFSGTAEKAHIAISKYKIWFTVKSIPMNSFIQSVSEVSSQSQIIMAITLNSHELIHIIDELDTDKYHKLEIADKAFKRFEKMGSREVSD